MAQIIEGELAWPWSMEMELPDEAADQRTRPFPRPLVLPVATEAGRKKP